MNRRKIKLCTSFQNEAFPVRVIMACLLPILFAFALATTAQTPASKAAQPSDSYPPSLDLTAMDTSVDPCADFYAYSCGGWIKNNPIPADQASWGVFSKLQEENRDVLRRILEQAAAPDSKRDAVNQKIGDFYASCIDEPAIEAAGNAALKPQFDAIASIKTRADIAAVLARVHAQDIYIYFGQAPLFAFGSTQDAKDSTQVIAEADQGGLGLPDRDYYLKSDARSQGIREKYVAHVSKMFELLGDAPQAATANAETVMRIETALAKGALPRVERRDPHKLYHKMTVAELQALSPSFNWKDYFAALAMPAVAALNVAVPGFFKTMEAALQSESLDAWKTYLRWHLVHANARWLSSRFVNEDFEFFGRTLTGARELQARWKRCVRYTDRALGEALGQAYVAQKFSPEAKQRTLKMVSGIEKAMEEEIRQLPWMSEPTKKEALTKLHAVVNKIGYPDKWRDYSPLKIVRGDALGNGQRANQFEFHRQLRKIGKPVERGEWLITPPTVNAYYNPQMNDINFPAGVLQPPLFDPRMDDAPNYGDTGGTIGHELTHGFDDEGRQFDAQGNLRDWWTAEDAKEFEKRAACIADQYAQYTIVDDIKINSKLTLGEDVADLGGLLLAYIAWQDATRGQNLKPLGGLTPEQRFFIGYGQSWCSNQREEIMRMRATVDPHSPPKYRTNGVVSNMPQFQKAFSCKAGAAMVREDACKVW